MSLEGWKTGAWIALGTAIGATAIASAAYFLTFGAQVSEDHSRWAEFGSFFGGVFAVATACASIAIAIYASIILPERISREAQAIRAQSELSAMSTRFYDREFYLHIMVPAWECSTKWTLWEGWDGDFYRYNVSGGGEVFEAAQFKTIAEANQAKFQNTIHERGHYKDILLGQDYPKANEHMLLTMWWAFWEELAYLIAAKLVDGSEAANRFSTQYLYWLDFHQQFWMVTVLQNGEVIPKTWRDVVPCESPSSRAQCLWTLEKIFYGDRIAERFSQNRRKALEIFKSFGKFD